MKAGNKKATKNSGDTKEKDDSTKEKDKDDQCKLVTQESVTSCHPSILGSCGCQASMDNTVSSIPQSAD